MNEPSKASRFTFSDREMPVRLGRYHLLSRMRRDPVGEEFLAAWGVDEGIEQLRVIRCIYPHVALEAQFVGLFSEEARALSRLSSTNVARIMEVGSEKGIPYVAREHVEGITLDRLADLARRRTSLWPWELAAHVTAELLRGLDYVHRREDIHGRPMGMRHGDVRPENVVVSFGGEVKLFNFGSTLRFIVDEMTNARLSELRDVFMPPEGNDDLEPSVAADLWGAGLVLLVLLGGNIPMKRPGRDDLWLPQAMGNRVENLPPVVDSFIARALNPDPEFRFLTASDMRGALVDIMAGHASGHPPDDLARWIKELGHDDQAGEAALVRKMLGQPAEMALENTVNASGTLGPGFILDGRYHLIRQLGEGGMGLVFEAEHMGLDRRVAVKVLHDRVIDEPNTVERFRREARIIGHLGHPNIVGALDFGVSGDGHHYLAMDLLEGKSLSQRIWEKNLGFAELATALSEVCDGLQAAHDAGVIHRDLKPDNVFITPGGARILDFGIAKSTGLDTESTQLTRTGHICGTVDYIAPEQIRGVSYDPRSDIYAVGVILYEALTGETPFHGRTVGESLHKAINDKVVPPRKRCPEKRIPSRLEAVCLKALEKKAANRFATARDMAMALRLVADSLTPADPVTGGAPMTVKTISGAPRPRHSRRFEMTVAGISTLVLLAAVIFFLQPVSTTKPPRAITDVPVSRPPVSAPASAVTPPGTPTIEKVSSVAVTGVNVPQQPEEPESDPVVSAPEPSIIAETLIAEGERYLKNRNYDGARERFSEALKQDSRQSAAWFGLGQVAYQEGDYATAIDTVSRSLRYAPGNRKRRIFLGVIYSAAGDQQRAVVEWRKVLKSFPDDAEAKRHIERVGATP